MARATLDRLGPQRFPARPTTSVHVEPLLASVHEYRLAEHDARIAQHCQTIERCPGAPAAQRAAQHLAILVQPRIVFHRDHPFPVPLPTELTGTFTIGTVTATGRPAGLTVQQLLGQGMLTGRSGAGKTTAIRHLIHACNAARKTILDWKNDFDYLLADERFLLIDQTTPWNPRITPPWLSPAAYQHVFTEHYLAANYAAVHQRDIFTHRWLATNHPTATITDLIAPPPTGRPTFQELDARRNHNARIERFAPWALSTTPAGITWEDIVAHNILLRVDDLDDVARFLWSLLVNVTYLKNRREQRRDTLTDLLINDEAYDLYPREQRGITTDPLLGEKQRWREYGIASVTSTTSYRTLHPLSTASMGWLLALVPGNAEEAHAISRSLDLNADQTRAFMRLGTGEGLLRTNDVPYPTHITLTPFPTTKSISPSVLRAARDRVAALARRHQPEHTKLLAAREGNEGPGWPTPSPTPAPSSAPPARVAPAVEELPHNTGVPSNTKRDALPLNDRERKILTYIAQRGVLLVTELHAELHLHAMQESRTRKNLRALGFLDEHRIIVRSGRGGTAIALTATDKAYELLHAAKPHLGKGGAQHRFFLRELRDHLGATLEVHGSDAVITYNTEKHAALQRALGIALNNGDTIAFEVECSKPARTAPRNVERDKHFAYTVIATLPEHVERLRTTHASERVIVVNVLDILDKVRA